MVRIPRALIVVNIACRERHDSRGLGRVGGSSLCWGGKGLACLQVRFSRSRYRLGWKRFFLKIGTCNAYASALICRLAVVTHAVVLIDRPRKLCKLPF